MSSLLERHAAKIVGVLSCYDRVLSQGTLPGLCYAVGMAAFPRQCGIRLWDYPCFAEPYRTQIRENAEALAREHGIQVQFMRNTSLRKDERIAAVIQERGDHPGLVHIRSAMEACPSYRPWHDKRAGTPS